MRVETFQPAHLQRLQLQPNQPDEGGVILGPGYGEMLLEGDAFTVFDDAGTVLGCLGVYPLWPGRGYAWALLAHDAGRVLLPLTRAVRWYLGRAEFHRIEAHVDPRFANGRRWVERLGFAYEGLMRKCTPAGADQLLFARVR
jgi:RimJ/RimL family protein N-acetyltransferase